MVPALPLAVELADEARVVGRTIGRPRRGPVLLLVAAHLGKLEPGKIVLVHKLVVEPGREIGPFHKLEAAVVVKILISADGPAKHGADAAGRIERHVGRLAALDRLVPKCRGNFGVDPPARPRQRLFHIRRLGVDRSNQVVDPGP